MTIAQLAHSRYLDRCNLWAMMKRCVAAIASPPSCFAFASACMSHQWFILWFLYEKLIVIINLSQSTCRYVASARDSNRRTRMDDSQVVNADGAPPLWARLPLDILQSVSVNLHESDQAAARLTCSAWRVGISFGVTRLRPRTVPNAGGQRMIHACRFVHVIACHDNNLKTCV